MLYHNYEKNKIFIINIILAVILLTPSDIIGKLQNHAN